MATSNEGTSTDKHVKPPPKHPNEWSTSETTTKDQSTNDAEVTSWGEFFGSLRNTNIITDPLETYPKKHKCSSDSRLVVLESRMQELEAEIAKLK